MTRMLTTTVRTPDGHFTILADEDAVLAAGWTHDVATLAALVHPTIRSGFDRVQAYSDGDHRAVLSRAVSAVHAYYDGELAAPATVPVRQQSGEFRMQAWEALRRVRPGEFLTYREYAQLAGRPSAIRAAAGACAMNAAALFVPCHRILRSDGSLGGFRYGLGIKRQLLERESGAAISDLLF